MLRGRSRSSLRAGLCQRRVRPPHHGHKHVRRRGPAESLLRAVRRWNKTAVGGGDFDVVVPRVRRFRREAASPGVVPHRSQQSQQRHLLGVGACAADRQRQRQPDAEPRQKVRGSGQSVFTTRRGFHAGPDKSLKAEATKGTPVTQNAS